VSGPSPQGPLPHPAPLPRHKTKGVDYRCSARLLVGCFKWRFGDRRYVCASWEMSPRGVKSDFHSTVSLLVPSFCLITFLLSAPLLLFMHHLFFFFLFFPHLTHLFVCLYSLSTALPLLLFPYLATVPLHLLHPILLTPPHPQFHPFCVQALLQIGVLDKERSYSGNINNLTGCVKAQPRNRSYSCSEGSPVRKRQGIKKIEGNENTEVLS